MPTPSLGPRPLLVHLEIKCLKTQFPESASGSITLAADELCNRMLVPADRDVELGVVPVNPFQQIN